MIGSRGYTEGKTSITDSLGRTIEISEGIDDIGFTTRYMYQPYDVNWKSYSSYEERMRKRGTVRNYMDPYALTYNGYHPVTNIYYSYQDSTGATKTLERRLSGNSPGSVDGSELLCKTRLALGN